MVQQSWSSDIKKRREEQLKLIQKGQSAHFQSRSKDWEDPFEKNRNILPWNAPQKKKKRGNRFLLQTFFSVLFLFLTYLVFQSHSPAMKPVESFVYEVMTREFNFAGTKDLYNKYVGNMPSVLPAFSNQTPVKSTILWKVPIHGKVVLPFDNKRKGVVIRTNPKQHVSASTEGWVTFSGYKKGFGNMVIIRHANKTETRYGWLNDLKVKEKDWVKSGQFIGDVALTKSQPLLYFAMKKDGEYIDPSGVISFE